MSTLMQSIANLINKEIRKFVEKMHEEFPEINMLAIWCELEGEDNTFQRIYVDTAKVKGAMPKPHLPGGFNYCGPFTKFNERLARSDN
jgi:hypothetical protein